MPANASNQVNQAERVRLAPKDRLAIYLTGVCPSRPFAPMKILAVVGLSLAAATVMMGACVSAPAPAVEGEQLVEEREAETEPPATATLQPATATTGPTKNLATATLPPATEKPSPPTATIGPATSTPKPPAPTATEVAPVNENISAELDRKSQVLLEMPPGYQFSYEMADLSSNPDPNRLIQVGFIDDYAAQTWLEVSRELFRVPAETVGQIPMLDLETNEFVDTPVTPETKVKVRLLIGDSDLSVNLGGKKIKPLFLQGPTVDEFGTIMVRGAGGNSEIEYWMVVKPSSISLTDLFYLTGPLTSFSGYLNIPKDWFEGGIADRKRNKVWMDVDVVGAVSRDLWPVRNRIKLSQNDSIRSPLKEIG